MSALDKLKGFCRSVFGAGNGDGVGEDDQEQRFFHNPLLEPVPCWRALPIVAQSEVLQFLDHVSLTKLGMVARYEWYIVESFGFHVVVPARNWSFNFVPPKQKLICDSTVKKMIDGMTGKLIRGLELNEMPPPGVPGETATALVQRLISFPSILFQLHLAFVDVELINAFLNQCGNLRSLNYQTSLYRPIPAGPIPTILLGATFTPARIPAVGERLIRQIPVQALHLPNLTSLTLELRQASAPLGSDWANPMYILLAVSPPNLKRFNFCLDLSAFRIHYKVTVLIHSIIAEFLSKVRGTMKTFVFASTDTLDNIVNVPAALHYGLHRITALPVLSQLVERFGSPKLQNIFGSLQNGSLTMVRRRSEDFLQEIANELRCLEGFEINSRVRDLEMTHWLKFVQRIPAVTSLTIQDDYVGHPPEIYKMFIPPLPPLRIRSSATLQKLRIVRTKGMVPRFALEQFLEAIPNLQELELTHCRTGLESFQQDDDYSSAAVSAGGLVSVYYGRLSIQLPDVTIQVEPPVDTRVFQRLQVLKLQGFHLFARDVRKLRIFRNLRKLHLEIPPGLKHSFFGVESADLLELVATLRKLNYINVWPVQFPLGRDNRVALTHRNALSGIGTLVQNNWSYIQ